MASYTDTSLIAATLKRELTDNEALSLSVIIPAIQKFIDSKVGTTFLEATTATSRYYDGGTHVIDLEPCSAIEEIASVDPYTSADYYLFNQNNVTEVLAEPRNETIKNELRYRNGHFPMGEDNIRVKAKFSSYDGGIPEDIITIATMIAIEILRLGALGLNNLKRESLEGHEVMYHDPLMLMQSLYESNPYISTILAQYNEYML